MTDITGEELLARYAAGERDFRGANLQGIELQYARLNGINFSRTVLYDARLCRIDLSGADLSGARLGDAVIEDIDLSEANLSGAVLQGASVRRSCMEGVNFENAILVEMGMEDSRLDKANFRDAYLCETSFQRCVFQDAIVDINELRGCYLTQTRLPDGEIVTNLIED